MRKLWLKYQFWRRIIIANPIYIDGNGDYCTGAPLTGFKLWALRIKLWFGIKFVDDIQINDPASEPFTGAILGGKSWNYELSPEEVAKDYERNCKDDA